MSNYIIRDCCDCKFLEISDGNLRCLKDGDYREYPEDDCKDYEKREDDKVAREVWEWW